MSDKLEAYKLKEDQEFQEISQWMDECSTLEDLGQMTCLLASKAGFKEIPAVKNEADQNEFSSTSIEEADTSSDEEEVEDTKSNISTDSDETLKVC